MSIEKLSAVVYLGVDTEITNKINEIIGVLNANDKFDEADIAMATYFTKKEDYISKKELKEKLVGMYKVDMSLTGRNFEELIEHFNL